MESVIGPFFTRRLIVLLPDCLANDMALAHKIHWMALRFQSDVLYLTMTDDEEKLAETARCMTTMRAATSANFLTVESKIIKTARWLETLREIYRPGDRIVCQEEQTVKNGFLRTVPVIDFLRENLHAPLIPVTGFYHPEQVQVRVWVRSLAVWLGFCLILALFTFMEIELDGLLQGLVGKFLLCVVVALEIGAIWAWDSLSSH